MLAQKVLAYIYNFKCVPIFSFSSFGISGFKLGSFIHFEFILVKGERYRSTSILLKVDILLQFNH